MHDSAFLLSSDYIEQLKLNNGCLIHNLLRFERDEISAKSTLITLRIYK